MKFFKYFLVILIIFAAILIIRSKFQVSPQEIVQLFKEADKSLIVFVIGFQTLCYFSDGWLSKIILRIVGFNISLRDTVKVAILGVLGSQMTPVIGGTVITYYFFRKLKLPSNIILFLVATWAIFVWFNYFLFFVLSLPFLSRQFLNQVFSKSILITSIIILLFLILVFFLFRKKGKNFLSILNFFVKAINGAGKYFRKTALIGPETPKIFISNFYKNIEFLSAKKRESAKALFASFLLYFGAIATLYFSFLVFGYQPDLARLIFGFTAVSLITGFTFIPVTPGLMEVSLAAVFASVGFPAHISLFSSLLYRLFSYWLPLLLGFFFVFKSKKQRF